MVLPSPTSCDEPTREGPGTGPLAHHVHSPIDVPGRSCPRARSRRVRQRRDRRGSSARHVDRRGAAGGVRRRFAASGGAGQGRERPTPRLDDAATRARAASVEAVQVSERRVQADEVGEGLLCESERGKQLLDGGVHRVSLRLGRPVLPRLRHRPWLSLARSLDAATAPPPPGASDTRVGPRRSSLGAVWASPLAKTGHQSVEAGLLRAASGATVGQHRAGTMAR